MTVRNNMLTNTTVHKPSTTRPRKMPMGRCSADLSVSATSATPRKLELNLSSPEGKPCLPESEKETHIKNTMFDPDTMRTSKPCQSNPGYLAVTSSSLPYSTLLGPHRTPPYRIRSRDIMRNAVEQRFLRRHSRTASPERRTVDGRRNILRQEEYSRLLELGLEDMGNWDNGKDRSQRPRDSIVVYYFQVQRRFDKLLTGTQG